MRQRRAKNPSAVVVISAAAPARRWLYLFSRPRFLRPLLPVRGILRPFIPIDSLECTASRLFPHLVEDLLTEAARDHSKRPCTLAGLADSMGYAALLPSEPVNLIRLDPRLLMVEA